MLDDDDATQDPTARRESFVIGCGETLAEACRAARADLEQALGNLEVMAHDAGAPL
jgi:hypothetical protein